MRDRLLIVSLGIMVVLVGGGSVDPAGGETRANSNRAREREDERLRFFASQNRRNRFAT